ncbi:MAG: YggS family pyridoxal phosphate-dependent enzyme [Chloroflexi bacterium]|nr:YggS family pyridoxal phosphate-dependent enzyme [Chloroflexota bacterium]
MVLASRRAGQDGPLWCGDWVAVNGDKLPICPTRSGVSNINLRDNLQHVHDRIAAAAARAGRDRASITLVAVSKTQPVEAVVEAYSLGVRDFGENRVEEAALKHLVFRQRVFDQSVTFHMIGHVQSRKAGEVAAWSDRVHSVDSLKLAQRLDRFAATNHKVLPILLEVNVSGEASKYGFDHTRLDEVYAAIDGMLPLAHVRLDGLMTMAPIVEQPEQARPVFSGLRAVRDKLAARCGLPLPQLSMGMTDDFEVAIEEGATLVRVGRAIFGERQTGQT